MRASRLLSILMLLQDNQGKTASSLAAKLEVSVRTILRDIDQLSAAGVPVWAERGRDGGFRLKDGWRTNLTGLTENEAQALLLAGLPSAAMELGLGNASASAQLKLLSVLPKQQREEALKVSSRLHLDPIDWFRVAAPVEHLRLVADAVWHQQPVSVRYESWKSTGDRALKPLGLVLKAGFWYMVAMTETTTEPRIYKLSKIQNIAIHAGHFQRPTNFNLADFWQTATKRFESNSFKDEAKLRVNSAGMKLLLQLGSSAMSTALASAKPDPKNSDLSLITIPIESTDYTARYLLSLGSDIELLEPQDLRDKITELARKINQVYSDEILTTPAPTK